MSQPEYDKSEKPLIDQLVAMGWEHLRGAPPGSSTATDVRASERAAFTEVVYTDRFRDAVARINTRPGGGTWLSDAQLDHLTARVLGTARGQGRTGRGVAGNLDVTRMLRDGIPARTVPGWRKGDPEHIRLVDWDAEFKRGNDLLAVSQFRIERKNAGPVTPDIVLFVNGLPWVVVECKAPLTPRAGQEAGPDSRAALDQAVEQVIGYAGVEAPAPVAEFVRFAQVLVATDRDHAEIGTVTAEPANFAPWRSVYPASEELVRKETGRRAAAPLSDQDVLVAGALRPAHLLTLVRDFTTQAGEGPRTVKVIGRYQQFRAVQKLARRLRDRQVAAATGEEPAQRGGVVWHTQGSGKSLTMAFLVRHLRGTPDLAGHKVVVVTDRLDLEKQIRESLGAAEEKIHRAGSVRRARTYLEVDVPDVVLVMIQKARKDDTVDDGTQESLGEEPDAEQRLHNRIANPSADIVVLVDEAHRGHATWQHARLRAMLPNAAVVGFTGTPIISKNRKTTEEIFGSYADIYTLRDAERDGSVVPVRYEAYSVPLEVVEQAALDLRFDEEVPDDPEQRERVLKKFARRKEVLEAPSVIADKADHMLRHWAKFALPDRFGAQIVGVTRKAAVQYRAELLKARDRLLERLDALDPALRYDPFAAQHADDEERELLDLQDHRELLASIDAAVVISEAQNGRTDPDSWKDWTAKSQQRKYIARFKKGLGDPLAAADDPSWDADTHGTENPGWGTAGSNGEAWHTDTEANPPADGGEPEEEPLAFLVVQSMLLTGFDAPVEQVLYLDCALSGVNLLQAIARTNRPYPAKKWGQVVDYIGIGPELARSLGEYEQAHLRQVLGYDQVSAEHLSREYDPSSEEDRKKQPDRDQLLVRTDIAADALLRDLDKRITAFLADQRITSLAEEAHREDLLAALADPLLCAEFDELVRDFLTALNAVLPRPAALAYEDRARLLGEVQYVARRRYLDGRDHFSPRRYGAKVRQLISRHLKVSRIEQRIPPVELSAPDFMERVDANPSPRARTAYMSSRVSLHITAKIGSDRARYTKFSERLDTIVQRMAQDFEQAAADLARLVSDINAAESADQDGDGLDPWTEGPVCRLLRQQLEEAGAVPGPPGADIELAARALTAKIAILVRPRHFLTMADAQNQVRRQLRGYLEEHLDMDWDDTSVLANHLVELALERRDDFLRYGERQDGDATGG
ncbi:type I restriction endonuclease subunit R [Streptomyces sp. NBC_01236]|uniref:type I restriction endonuclease subunit R n=1 Tax=Streptomyces sp. NBC_01236 TaxID=2903789 RepID=UPI002E109B2D|nr:type I restriction endonuclease [Streptomyces sp. NBC_01236]